MTKQERHTLCHVIENTRYPSAPGSAYDENFQPIKVQELVPGTPNHQLLDSEEYKAGYHRAWVEITKQLEWLFLDSRTHQKDLIKYAGKAK